MRTKWSSYEVQELKELNQLHRTDNNIAVILGKPRKAVISKRQHIGLKESPFSTALRKCNRRRYEGKSERNALKDIKEFIGGKK